MDSRSDGAKQLEEGLLLNKDPLIDKDPVELDPAQLEAGRFVNAANTLKKGEEDQKDLQSPEIEKDVTVEKKSKHHDVGSSLTEEHKHAAEEACHLTNKLTKQQLLLRLFQEVGVPDRQLPEIQVQDVSTSKPAPPSAYSTAIGQPGSSQQGTSSSASHSTGNPSKEWDELLEYVKKQESQDPLLTQDSFEKKKNPFKVPGSHHQ